MVADLRGVRLEALAVGCQVRLRVLRLSRSAGCRRVVGAGAFAPYWVALRPKQLCCSFPDWPVEGRSSSVS